jgi:hypothetical protein
MTLNPVVERTGWTERSRVATDPRTLVLQPTRARVTWLAVHLDIRFLSTPQHC